MAYVVYAEEGITKEQAETLRELTSFQQISETNAWKKITEHLQAIVDEAQEELLGSGPEVTLEQRGLLSLRWQQRIAIQRDLLTFVESHLSERNKLLEEIKEQVNEHSNDTGNNDQQ